MGKVANMVVLVAVVLHIIQWIVQWRMQNVVSKYYQIQNNHDLSGEHVVRGILGPNTEVGIEMITGVLTDHFDPSAKKIRLGEATYLSPSVASLGIAAQMASYVLTAGSPLVRLRMYMVPLGQLFLLMGFWTSVVVSLISSSFLPFCLAVYMLGIAMSIPTILVLWLARNRALSELKKRNLASQSELSSIEEILFMTTLSYGIGCFVPGTMLALLQNLLTRR